MVSDTNEDGPSPDTELSKELSGLNLPQTPLLSVAVWGWQGDGKTTSLLTAVHYTHHLPAPGRHDPCCKAKRRRGRRVVADRQRHAS